MDSSSIELPGSKVTSVTIDGDQIRVRFEPAYIIKNMTGSQERTKWWQNGELIFSGAELEGELPELPADCSGGDVGENIYTYRDMIPLPLSSSGHAHCNIKIAGSDLTIRIQGSAVETQMEGVPRYIEHIRPA